MYCSKCGKPLQAGGSLPGAHAAREVPQASRRPFIHRGGPGSFDFSDFVECVWPDVLFRWLRHHRDWLEPLLWAFGRRDSAGRYLAKGGPYGNLRRQLALLGALVAILAVVLLCSAFLNGAGAALRPMSPAPILRRIPTNPAIAHRSTSRPFFPTT